MIRPVTPEALKELLAAARSDAPRGSRLFVWDVRSPEAFLAGHVPGSRQLPHKDVMRWVPQIADFLDTLVIVDADGAPFGDARNVAHELFHRWFRKMHFLAGGFAAWSAGGYPVDTGGAAGPGSASQDGAQPFALTSGEVPWGTGHFAGARHPVKPYAPPSKASK